MECLRCKGQILFNPKSHSNDTKKYCSRICYSESQKGRATWNKGMKGYLSGDKHYKWKGGNSRGYKTGYYSTEYIEWRKSVFKRDNYKCRECGGTGYLTAHHIKSFTHYPQLRYELNNGLTLCESCHSKTDNYKGRANKKNHYELHK